jgi:lysyl-tRNA synthetase, class I
MFQKPREAKRLHFDVIPRAMDDYAQFLDGFPRQDLKSSLSNPAWHLHGGHPPASETVGGAPVSFALLLNLAAVANAEDKSVLWGFIKRYAPGADPATHPSLDRMAGYAVRYFQDFVKPKKIYRLATADEHVALTDLAARLDALTKDGITDASAIQDAVYDIGRRDPYRTQNKDGTYGVSLSWFNTLYEILLGEPKGPRFGTFAALYGTLNTRALIEKALSGALMAEHEVFKMSKK